MSLPEPWSRLDPPNSDSAISLLRVDAEHPWNLFWGRSGEEILFVVRFDQDIQLHGKLPKLKGVSTTIVGTPEKITALVIHLMQLSDALVFRSFCEDLAENTRPSKDEQAMCDAIISRVWSWHRFLQVGARNLLTDEEQRGLVGELTLMTRVMFPSMGVEAALDAWTGPFGTARDFEVGTGCAELKSRRNASLPFLEISSEFQLDPVGLSRLLLIVANVSTSTKANAQSLDEVVRRVRSQCLPYGDALNRLNERLLAVGYHDPGKYGERKYVVDQMSFYDVRKEFPSVRAESIPDGVSDVRYRLSLDAIEEFQISESDIHEWLAGELK